MEPIAHFTISMMSSTAFCGIPVISVANKPGEAVYHKKHESPVSVAERGEVPCTACVARSPLVDLSEAQL